MAMDNPAIPLDLADRGYQLSESKTVEQTRLDEAWRALKSEIPSLTVRLAAGQVDHCSVVDVVCAAALRVLRNPEGHSREDYSIDDYREGWTLSDSSIDMYFTSAELRRLTPPVYGAGSMSFT